MKSPFALLAALGLASGLPLAATAGTPDDDGDTIPAALDNCPFTANANQADFDSDLIGDVCDNCSARAAIVAGLNDCDIDSDGYGGPCDCDMTQPADFICQIVDFAVLASNFGMPPTPLLATDLNCDGITQITDFSVLSLGFGMPPGPSGLACAGAPICTP